VTDEEVVRVCALDIQVSDGFYHIIYLYTTVIIYVGDVKCIWDTGVWVSDKTRSEYIVRRRVALVMAEDDDTDGT